MVWTDYKKAPDIVQQSSLKMYKISGEVIKFIENIIENWSVELTTGRKSFAEVKIQSVKVFRNYTECVNIYVQCIRFPLSIK